MREEAVSQGANFREGDARDVLARLYREIGISAVAAALNVGVPAPRGKNTEADSASASPSRKSSDKGLAA